MYDVCFDVVVLIKTLERLLIIHMYAYYSIISSFIYDNKVYLCFIL